jgi:hypothetical protein
MAKFYARVEDGQGAFREIILFAESESAARQIIRRREMKLAAHRLPPDRLAELEDKEAAGSAEKTDLVELQYHRQEDPFEIVYLGASRYTGREAS